MIREITHFNSRPRKEVDRNPTVLTVGVCHFNSRPRKEVDKTVTQKVAAVFTFQLTTSQGGRLHWFTPFNNSSTYFNSRPRKEVDCARQLHGTNDGYFNSRPRKEVDKRKGLSPEQEEYISTHDLARRSTDVLKILVLSCDISTHDLARRSTAIFTQKVFLSKSLFVLIAYNIFILY